MGNQADKLYDLIIVGGGPAGAAAAILAARDKATVALLEQELPRRQTHLGWIGPAGVGLCKECGLNLKKAGAVEFAGVQLHSWDLKRSASVDDPELQGWLVNQPAFDHALLKQAAAAGAETLQGVVIQDVNLAEDRVELQLRGGRVVAGNVLVVGDGVTSPAARLANLTCAGSASDVPQCLCVEYEGPEKAAQLEVAISASRAGQLATILRLGKRVRLSMMTRAAESSAADEFGRFCQRAVESGLLPGGMPREPAREICPGGVALDMDTHVGKRCLLIGEAGGFMAAFSGEEIYPTMRSGWIAAESALGALRAPVLQDELASFGAAWRGELADYLRMPNTDLSLLVPLVFNNAEMSRRVARAFLLGQPF